jgi:sialate O-acetylesterase
MKCLVILLLFTNFLSFGQIRTAKIFSDNMVLQRDVTIPVWGTATPGEQITVQLAASRASATTLPDGTWKIYLPRLSEGGPWILKIKGATNQIEYKNVLIGDVWFASGQSNMEHPVSGWEWIPYSAISNFKEEIADSNYPEIRLFTVPKYPSPKEQPDLQSGKWEMAAPATVSGFSSTAWFFGKELYQKLKVPVGLIHCSWAGTPIQTWMSRELLEIFKDSLMLPEVPATFDAHDWTEKMAESIEMSRIRRNQISYPKPELPDRINSSNFDDSKWESAELLNGKSHFGNVVWFRKTFVVPDPFASQHLLLSLGFLNRQSQVFLNGTELGYFLYPQPVKIEIPPQIVLNGENVLTIRLAQPFGESQVLGKKEQFWLSNSDQSFVTDLSGTWKVNNQLEKVIPAAKSYQNNPAYLFNGMVAPVIPYAMKGFIWFQGESDASRPLLYENMFRHLIADWRKLWRQDDLPFLFIQTSNIELTHESGTYDDSWCLLREAQQQALSLTNTGMVVSADIGNPFDVHPKNKQDFGYRLALQAFKVAYHQDVIADGPVFGSLEIKGDTVVVLMKERDSQLVTITPLNLPGFEIAAKEGPYYEAKAFLKNNKVHIFSDRIKSPAKIRYGWRNNPRCSVFNLAGLPLAPFRFENLHH